MDRNFCYLLNISHPDGCDENYVILNIDCISLCIKEYMSDYNVSSFDDCTILIKRVFFKGGDVNGKGLQSSSKK